MSGLAWGIAGFVGPNGSGKTLAMTAAMAVPAWEAGRIVVANYRLDPTVLGFSADLYRPLESWRDLSKLGRLENPAESLTGNEGCVLLLDEITAAMPSRGAMSMPPELQRLLNQFRKPDVRVGWSAPAWARADLMLREVTQVVCLAKGYKPDRYLRESDGRPIVVDGSKLRASAEWASNRQFRWVFYDAYEFEEFSIDAAKQCEPVAVRWFDRLSGASSDYRLPLLLRAMGNRGARRVDLAYDTRQAVMLLDNVESECAHCGGYRARVKCSCKPERAIGHAHAVKS